MHWASAWPCSITLLMTQLIFYVPLKQSAICTSATQESYLHLHVQQRDDKKQNRQLSLKEEQVTRRARAKWWLVPVRLSLIYKQSYE